MSGHTLAAIAREVGGVLQGNPDQVIERVRDVEEAAHGDLCVIMDRRHPSHLTTLGASAFIVPPGVEGPGLNVIKVDNPRAALIRVLELFYPEAKRAGGIEAGAFVSQHARMGADVFVAAGATVEAGATVGDRCQILGHAYVGEEVVIGHDSVIFPNVTLYAGVRLGCRVRIHSGAVIGSDGFGYDRDSAGVQHKIPQVGTVQIGDDVEVGANTTVDRATLGVTRIGDGTKIDNLVQIGHNSTIGKHCCLVGQVGLSGSVTLGDYCVLAGQVGVADHVTLADHAIVGAQAGVHRDLGPGPWLGSPALPAGEAYRVYTTLSRLPEMRRSLHVLEERLKKLESTVERQGTNGNEGV